MNIYKKDGKIIFEVNEFSKRENPYMEDDAECGSHPTLIGLIEKHRENGNDYDEIGFAYVIDMGYKGKEDQNTGVIIKWDGDEDSFKEKCLELGIDIIYYPNCAKCGKVLYGAFSWEEDGYKCSDCERT